MFDSISIDAVWEFLKNQMLVNNFLSGAVLGGVALALLNSLKSYLYGLWTFVRNRLYMSVTVHSSTTAFFSIGEWLVENKFDRFSRNYRTEYSYVTETLNRLPVQGSYWFFYKGWPIRAELERDNSPSSAGDPGSGSFVKEYITISYFGFSRARLDSMMEELQHRTLKRLDKLTGIYTADTYNWERAADISSKVSSCLCLDNGDKEMIEADIEHFLKSKDWYEKRNIPFQRGYLFYGPPGTGKTSLVRHLAAKFDRSIYMLNESDYTREDINTKVQKVPPNSILLLEDVDCFHQKRSETAEVDLKTVRDTFGVGSLLSALGGVVPLEDVIVVMTTNHIEKLDPALIRCGRIDKKVKLGYCTRSSFYQLVTKFYEGTEVDSARLEAALAYVETHEVSPAQAVEAMKQHPEDSTRALEAVLSL